MINTGTKTVSVHLRYFAAAAEAVGTREETLTLPAGATVNKIVCAVSTRNPAARRVLEISSMLVDGVTAQDKDAPLSAGDAVRVDVLPPFAGG